MSQKFTVMCSANEKVGLGHFSRCFNTVLAIRDINPHCSVTFLGDLNRFAKDKIADAKMYAVETQEGLAIDDSTVILDSYEIDQADIKRISSQARRIAKFDDFNTFDLSDVDLVINFRHGAETMKYTCRDSCLGLNYFPHHPAFKPIRLAKMEDDSSIDRKSPSVLVFVGGTDIHNIKPKIMEALVGIPGMFDITVVSPQSISSERMVGEKKINERPLTDSIASLYETADAIICGGGVTKYEAGYCLIPNACISQTLEQDEDTKIVASSGLTCDLGLASQFATQIGDLKTRLETFLTSAERTRQKRQMRNAFHTSSAKNLAQILVSLVDS